MKELAQPDHPEKLAASLGISREAAELHLSSDVIDLHVESFIWTRIIGYDLARRHGLGLLRGQWFHQADLPRAIAGGVSGATWSITTNFVPNADERVDNLVGNIASLKAALTKTGKARVVRTVTEYRAAREAGLHAALVGLQGGNAIDRAPHDLELLADGTVSRITLLHLTNSALGTSSSPLAGPIDHGMTARGRDFVRALNHRRILVDLAHASRRTFWDAIAVHDRAVPIVVTHTGVSGVWPHWRNLDDDQLRAIADRGGTIGVMLMARFLGRRREVTVDAVVQHLAHIIDTVGEDHASIGTDYDGWIRPPADLPSYAELPRLTHALLQRGYEPERVQKVLGRNFLRVLRDLRG